MAEMFIFVRREYLKHIADGVSGLRKTGSGGRIGFQLAWNVWIGSARNGVLMVATRAAVVWLVWIRRNSVEWVDNGAYLPVSGVL